MPLKIEIIISSDHSGDMISDDHIGSYKDSGRNSDSGSRIAKRIARNSSGFGILLDLISRMIDINSSKMNRDSSISVG